MNIDLTTGLPALPEGQYWSVGHDAKEVDYGRMNDSLTLVLRLKERVVVGKRVTYRFWPFGRELHDKYKVEVIESFHMHTIDPKEYTGQFEALDAARKAGDGWVVKPTLVGNVYDGMRVGTSGRPPYRIANITVNDDILLDSARIILGRVEKKRIEDEKRAAREAYLGDYPPKSIKSVSQQ